MDQNAQCPGLPPSSRPGSLLLGLPASGEAASLSDDRVGVERENLGSPRRPWRLRKTLSRAAAFSRTVACPTGWAGMLCSVPTSDQLLGATPCTKSLPRTKVTWDKDSFRLKASVPLSRGPAARIPDDKVPCSALVGAPPHPSAVCLCTYSRSFAHLPKTSKSQKQSWDLPPPHLPSVILSLPENPLLSSRTRGGKSLSSSYYDQTSHASSYLSGHFAPDRGWSGEADPLSQER